MKHHLIAGLPKCIELYPGRQQAQFRVDLLKQNKILFNGNLWTKKQFTDQLSRARERMKTRQKK